MTQPSLWALCCLLVLASCTPVPSSPSYVEQVRDTPIPQDAADRQEACDQVREQLADQQNRASMASSGVLSPMLAMAAERQFSQRIAALENRASALQCTAAFSSAAAAAALAPPTSPINQCIAACLENTGRTKSQCFDDCNH